MAYQLISKNKYMRNGILSHDSMPFFCKLLENIIIFIVYFLRQNSSNCFSWKDDALPEK